MNPRLPALNGLQAFEAVARHRSFTRAAEELRLTQTAISHRIGRLEAQLGFQLFLRHGRDVELSPAGQTYLPGVRSAFEALYRATTDLLDEGGSGELTVSTLVSFAAKWLVPRLADFQSAHPEVAVRILTSPLPVDFARESIDLAIRYGDGRWPGLRADLLLREETFPVCSPKLLADSGRLSCPEDLAGHVLIHNTAFPEDWARWLAAVGQPDLDAKAHLRFDLGFAAIEAAADGAGVAMGRRSLAGYDLSKGTLVAPFELRIPRQAYYLVAPRRGAERPKVKIFRDWLLTAA
ncbi:MAG: transcriptional regulator GcvA [Pseudomonadota bacterium]